MFTARMIKLFAAVLDRDADRVTEELLRNGVMQFINITDTGNLYKINQEVSLSNQEALNLTYFLDTEHDWQVSKIETSINNLQDTRNWINNSGFTKPTIFRKYQVSQTDHLFQ